jgi:hypothetical protein
MPAVKYLQMKKLRASRQLTGLLYWSPNREGNYMTGNSSPQSTEGFVSPPVHNNQASTLPSSHSA